MAGRRRPDTTADEPYRDLIHKSDRSLRNLISFAGIDTGKGYKNVHEWLEGKVIRKTERYWPELLEPVRAKLLTALQRLYPDQMEAIKKAHPHLEWQRQLAARRIR